MLSYFNCKWASFLTSISLLASVTRGQVQSDIEEHAQEPNKVNDVFDEIVKTAPSLAPLQVNSDGIGPVLIVSTMDGKVSALDMKKGGNLIWSVDIGQGPLVSSSISKLLVKQNGKIVRLIPSLSGGLFQFDGKSVEAVPFTADHLLSSSFKVTDDSILVGGKEVTTFGLDTSTGKIIYICSSSGCENIEEASSASDVIIIKRQQQTVRSVENRNGQEKWNFTVGEVQLDISKGKKFNLLEHSGDGAEKQKDSDNRFPNPSEKEESMFDDENEDPLNDSRFSNYLERTKILLPEGVVCLFNAQSKQKLEWKHQFGSAIANAWYEENGNYRKLDLFDPNTVPALSEKNKQMGNIDNPTIYMGFYKSHVYIQVSSSTKKSISHTASQPKGLSSVFYQPLKFPYRPYLGTADQLTEAVIGEAKDGEIAIRKESNSKGKCGNSLAVYTDKSKPQSEMGYFFKSDASFRGYVRESKRRGRTTVEDPGDESFGAIHIDVISSSFMHWWKEIFIITVTTSIFVQFLIVKVMQIFRQNNPPVNSESTSEYLDAQSQPVKPDLAASFESRYLHDFETIQCLGRGGFGVVFEARNKLDDCKYAVKRIRLPNKPSARDKVMREIGLAKLDHPCIVRYFNAWIEEPPQGWQEDRDKALTDLSTYTPSIAATSQPKNSVLKDETPSIFKSKHSASDSLGLHNRQSIGFGMGDTQGFTVGSYQTEDVTGDQKTGSFEISSRSNLKLPLNREQGNLGKFFQTSSSDSSMESDEENLNQSIPFGRYNKNDDSSSIVFQDDFEDGKQRLSSEDSAIVKDVCNKKGHHRNESECAELPTYEQLYGLHETSGLRKRSNSQKPETPTDSDTTGSELKSVVCQKNPGGTDIVEKNLKPNTSVYLYIQMQLCQKDSLRTWLANNNNNRDQIYSIWIFQQVVSAVEYVHECNLIHRDLKPSNIFFSFDGSVKVGDFGLVTAMDESSASAEICDDLPSSFEWIGAEVSRTERVGTKLYMAPEQMRSRTYCQKVDIFALGLILFELLVPFGTQMERIRDLTNVRKSRFRNDFEKNFPVVAELAKQMLSNTPVHRPTASEISNHDVFSVLSEVESIPNVQAPKNWNRKRTTSRS